LAEYRTYEKKIGGERSCHPEFAVEDEPRFQRVSGSMKRTPAQNLISYCYTEQSRSADGS